MSAQQSPIDPPNPLPVIDENIPEELKSYWQWVCWRYELVKTRWTKVPYRPRGGKASVIKTEHYSAFTDVIDAYAKGGFSGIGFVLTALDPIVAIDIDHCLEGGILTGEAKGIIESLNSYTEVSPSGTGIRILAKGTLPKNVKKGIEIYIHGRYITLTGQRWPL